MKFKGRVLYKGNLSGEALVSKKGVNILATYFKGMPTKDKRSLDQNNEYLYKKEIAGKILIIPECIGSITGGMMLQAASMNDIAPAAILFANHVDTLSSAGLVLSDIWADKKIIAIDNIGSDILNEVRSGDMVKIYENGEIEVKKIR